MQLMLMALGTVLVTGVQLERVPEDVRVPGVSVEELARAAAEDEGPLLLDVRLEEDFESDPVLIQGAERRDPNAIDQWASQLPPGAAVVVYCVRGKWVSQSVTKRLRDLGLDVSQLDGGIEAWKASGRSTRPARKAPPR